ncbi:MAG: SCO7613 C-terminal domain-containing membrane protein [Rhodoglobus sp.]
MNNYLPFVGFVQFPRNPRDLTNQVCPACLVDRVGVVCSSCGLNLASPLVAQLDSSSMDASAALDRRLQIIGRIRHDSAQAQAPAQPAVPAVPAAVASPAAAPAQAPVAAPAPAPDAPRRHLGVQVILLIVGVSLLSIGAIFFLVYAFITFGLVWRSVIIVSVSIAVIVSATLLKRRRLRTTAEAIAVLGAVFVYLDVFALKANDLFGAGDVDDRAYWGVALLLSAIGFAAWHRLSGLRLPNVIAFVTFAPGLALLVGGVFAGADGGLRAFASFAALALGSLIHGATRHRVESAIVAWLGIVGLVFAVLISPILPGDDWGSAVGLGIVALIALAQVALIARIGFPIAAGRTAAAIGAAAAASITFFVALRIDDRSFWAFWPLVGATVVALILELLARRARSSSVAPFARTATYSATGFIVATLISPTVYAFEPAGRLLAAASPRWSSPGGTLVRLQPENAAALLALLVVVVLAAAAWAVAGTIDERLPVVLAVGCATILLSVPLVGVLWAAVAAWLAVAAAGLVALRFARTRDWSPAIRITIASTSLAGMGLAYVSSWASIDTWWYGSVGVVALLLASRVVIDTGVIRAAALGLANVLALVAIAAEGFHVNERFAAGRGASLESVHAVALLAILLLITSALLASRLSMIETRVLFWIPLLAATGAGAVSWWTGAAWGVEQTGVLVLPYGPTSTLLALGMTGALALWRVMGPTAAYQVEKFAASALLAPTAAWALDSLARWASLPSFVQTIAPIMAALIVAAAALAVTVGRPTARLPLELGAVIVAVPAVLLAVGQDATWLVLVIAAVTALMLAISPDGLISSTSPRKHLGWLALALAVGGLWWGLNDAAFIDVELYVLPPAGALLLIALLGWHATRTAAVRSAAPPLIALGGLLVAILPIAVVAMTGPTVRTVSIAVSCAVLLLAASLAVRPAALRPYLDGAAIAGAVGLVLAGFGRAAVIALTPVRDDLQLDVWIAATVAVLVAAASVQARIPHEKTHRRRIEIGEAVIALAIGGVVIIEFTVLDNELIGTARALTVLVVLAATFVASLLIDRAPFTRAVGWVALVGGTIIGVSAIIVDAIDPLEWVTLIIAAALLTVGALQMRREPMRGSWPWLAPGLLVLIVPSLLATFTDAPIWRLVGLGVVCILVILLGALLRLQASLIIGSVVVLIHALRTFAPQIIEIYQLTEWWIWAVAGGAIILFVAITLERRIRDLRSVGSRISTLR